MSICNCGICIQKISTFFQYILKTDNYKEMKNQVNYIAENTWSTISLFRGYYILKRQIFSKVTNMTAFTLTTGSDGVPRLTQDLK